MTNKYIPLNKCSCGLKIWDYDENKDSVICKRYSKSKNTGCGTEIKKKLHNLIGASINKNKKGFYVLKFEEYKEENIYPDWETLQQEMEKLAKNGEAIKR